MTSTVNSEEKAHFDALSAQWWDEKGALKILHQMNPVRLSYIKSQVPGHIQGKRLLDIGCGGGLLSEPLARLGARVTGLDTSPMSIQVAKAHAHAQGLKIDYQARSIESFVSENDEDYDVITALEILEHVDNPAFFIEKSCVALKPGGLFFVSTLNQTVKSLLLGVFVAENILGWAPKGTHQWQKFMRPSQLVTLMRGHNLHLKDVSGLEYEACGHKWKISQNHDINYIAVFTKGNPL